MGPRVLRIGIDTQFHPGRQVEQLGPLSDPGYDQVLIASRGRQQQIVDEGQVRRIDGLPGDREDQVGR
jgi:hypothetical protein